MKLPGAAIPSVLILAVALWVSIASGDSEGAGNDIYRVFVEETTGGDGIGVFTVATGPAHPDGEGREVLFGEDGPEDAATSYITLRSYTTGTDYVQTSRGPGSGYLVEEMGPAGTVEPIAAGYRTTYDLGDAGLQDALTAESRVQVEGTTVANSLVRLKTTLTNAGSFPLEIGVRYLLDLAPYGDDGPARAVRGSDVVDTREGDISPGTIYQFWSSAPHDGPSLEVAPGGNVAADRAVYAYWPDAFGFAWDYTSRGRDIASDGGLNDAALLYYFGATRDTALRIDPGASVTVELVLRGGFPAVPATPTPTPSPGPQGATATPTPTPLRMPVALPRTGGR